MRSSMIHTAPLICAFAALSSFHNAQGWIHTTTTTTPISTRHHDHKYRQQSRLSASLKPAALPLMDSGKALARSGECLIDLTEEMGLYGGGLSAAGACLRNAGDSVAQAAASCRFKTGAELVSDELRTSGDCLLEGSDKVQAAVQEAVTDENPSLANTLERLAPPLRLAGESLERAGAAIMQQASVEDIGGCLVQGASQLDLLSPLLLELLPEQQKAQLSSQRMAAAASKMRLAGNELQGTPKPKATGKAWLKGG